VERRGGVSVYKKGKVHGPQGGGEIEIIADVLNAGGRLLV